jgi:beta-lactamase class D
MSAATIAVLFLLLISDAAAADLSKHFAGVDGTFVLLNGETGKYTRYNDKRSARRFPLCSTFKIPNTAILLESGVAPDPDFELRYNPALNLKARGLWLSIDYTYRRIDFCSAWGAG